MRIALISDTHLSPRSPECVANWHAARRAVQRLAPDATVHLGDITLDGQRFPEELEYASALVQQWPTQMRCLPGNHDVGDGSGELALDETLLAGYRKWFGPDRWSVTLDGWQLIGINAQLLGSDTPQEHEQWAWIEEIARLTPVDVRTALFLHRPVLRMDELKRSGRYVADAARDRLLGGPLSRTLRLVVSGHTHQYLDTTSSSVRHIWMPSSGFVLPDDMQARVGEKVVGLGVLDLDGGSMRFDLWCPDGMIRHDLSTMVAFSDLVEGH
jgi:3',5'-cyclic AMP phosphodiesterase CpdA